jgi:hypothetical protein
VIIERTCQNANDGCFNVWGGLRGKRKRQEKTRTGKSSYLLNEAKVLDRNDLSDSQLLPRLEMKFDPSIPTSTLDILV